jgi:type IV pilus assembly protein PilY1
MTLSLLTFDQLAKTTTLATHTRMRAVLAALAIALTGTLSFAQIATEPLLTKSVPNKPNFLFIMDDSGSMGGDLVEASHYARANGTCSDTTALKSSPVNNLLFYDPAKLYLPRRTNAGDPGTDVVVTNSSAPNTTVYIPQSTFDPVTVGSRGLICNTNKYDKIEVKSTEFRLNGVVKTTNPFGTKSTKRTDCNTATTCTLAQERQNIANWFAYHRTREGAARTGLGLAFADVPTTFRLSWATIHVANVAAVPVIKDYDLAKANFYTWLNTFPVDGYTPLRKALDIAGQYYSQDTNTGPWAHTPWAAGGNSEGEARNAHLSCRRSFTMLITDGQWNDAAASTVLATADVDSTNGPVITHANGTTKYQYIPRSTDLRSIGKADRIANNAAGYGNTLADVAMYYWRTDLRANTTTGLINNASNGGSNEPAFWQNMTTYTGAFGPVGTRSATQIQQARLGQLNWTDIAPVADANEAIDDLIHAAHNGGGKFLEVGDASSFAEKVGEVVKSIADIQYSQAGVAASAIVLTADTKKFIPTYNSASWWGNVTMRNLSASGADTGIAWEVISTIDGQPTGTTTFPTPINRKIYTYVSSSATNKVIPFELTPLSTNGLIASSISTNTSTLMNNSTTADLVNYIRGDQSKEGTLSTDLRPRKAILGDIVNSTPVFVKNYNVYDYSNLPAGAAKTAWAAYQTTKGTAAEGVLFVGANDGMLHGFREGVPTDLTIKPGSEVFAFIPRGVLGNLHLLAKKQPFSHQFFVDGPLAQADAYIDAPRKVLPGTSVRWANVLLGSTGAGGKSVFAIDVSYPTAMSDRSIMWEVNSSQTGFSNLGNMMSEVQTGLLDQGTWVAIFNNGPYGASGKASLFVVNLATGALIKEIPTNSATANGLGGVRVVKNSNGIIQGAYAGDLQGNVWKFNLLGASTTWASEKLFTAVSGTGTVQPITATPGVMPRSDTKPGYMVVVGTGKLFDINDQSNVAQQSAYGLWDNSAFGASINVISGRSSLVQNTVVAATNTFNFGSTTNAGATQLYNTVATRAVNWTTDRGWYIDYAQTAGQRSIYPIEPLGTLVRLDTVAPRQNQQACDVSASLGVNYLIDPLNGLCHTYSTLDTNKDGKFTAADDTACIYTTESDGQDVALGLTDDPTCTGPDCKKCEGPDCDKKCLFNIQDSNGFIDASCGNCSDTRYATLYPDSCKKGSPIDFRRDWRQIFMRK